MRDWAERLRTRHAALDVPPSFAHTRVEQAMSAWRGSPRARANTLCVAGEPVGVIATSLEPRGGTQVAVIVDLWVAPEHRRHGYGTQALTWAKRQASTQATSLWAAIDPIDSGHRALFGAYPLRSQLMIKAITGTEPLPSGVQARPMTHAEFEAWRAEAIRSYAADIADAGTLSPEDASVRATEQTDQLIPDGLATANHTFWSLYAGGDLVATNWLCHHREPGVSFVYGVEADERFRGRGYGRAAMLVGEHATLAAGDTHLALNVFGHNVVAMSLYSGMGYQSVEQYRSADL
jgi:GNAT superfamily N-acetyltransferase